MNREDRRGREAAFCEAKSSDKEERTWKTAQSTNKTKAIAHAQILFAIGTGFAAIV